MKNPNLSLKGLHYLSFILATAIFCHCTSTVSAQHYAGLGFHLTTPVYLENPENDHVITRPQPGFGHSITYKKVWNERRRNQWYLETGLSFQGLRYHQTNYTGDSLEIWTESPNTHTGFPSFLLGGGRQFHIGRSKGTCVLGAEASFLITQTLDAIITHNFIIQYDPSQHFINPFFLRLNIGYQHPFTFFERLPVQLEVYASLSAQNFAKGSQYILGFHQSEYLEGKYSVNNSELGLKLYTCLQRKYPKIKPLAPGPDPTIAGLKTEAKRMRFSIGTQWFRPSPTLYHIPRNSHYSISSRKSVLIPQYSAVAEWLFRKHPRWAVVTGIGFGPRVSTLVFESDEIYPADRLPIKFEKHIDYGHFALLNLGISRRFGYSTLQFAHTLSATLFVPLENEHAYMGVPMASRIGEMEPYTIPVLEGWIDRDLGREPVVAGLEYNPELIFSLKGPFFLGLGLVANYSNGVVAQGRFEVRNQSSTQYGATIQHFTKLGLSIRLGLER